MANVVITGSTRGIGLGMAREFRRLGHSVVISSRGSTAVDAALALGLAALMQSEAPEHALGIEQRDMGEAAECTISKQNIATLEHWMQGDGAAHVVLKQRQRQQFNEHPCCGIKQSHEFACGVADAGLLTWR